MPVTECTWDPVTDSILEETDGAENVLTSYTSEPSAYGPLVSQQRDGDSRYFHFDALGSTRELTDDEENVTDKYAYDAWGNELEWEGLTRTRYRYVGRLGYICGNHGPEVYVRGRHYCPLSSRWNSVDPLSGGVADTLYSYVQNQAVRLTDASGQAEDPLPEANDSWWITFRDAPTKLKNCAPDYQWVIRQRFRTRPPGPWGGRHPNQTWQLNISKASAKVFVDGVCADATLPDIVLMDVQPFPRRAVDGQLQVNIEDELALVRLKGLVGGAKICQLTETVDKRLGFHDGQPGNLPVGTRTPTQAQQQRLQAMRGPLLAMTTRYVFTSSCGDCKECFPVEQPTCGPPHKPSCMEEYSATVDRGATAGNLGTGAVAIGPWTETSPCP